MTLLLDVCCLMVLLPVPRDAERVARERQARAEQEEREIREEERDGRAPPVVGMVKPGFRAATRYTEQIFRGELEAEPFTLGSERTPCVFCGAMLFESEIDR